jgi:hypothetical protein
MSSLLALDQQRFVKLFWLPFAAFAVLLYEELKRIVRSTRPLGKDVAQRPDVWLVRMCCARLLEGFRQAPFADLQQTQVVRYVRTHGPCLVPAFEEHVLDPLSG